MTAAPLARHRAIHAEALALCVRATAALARACDAAAQAAETVERARVLHAAGWDGQIARWRERAEPVRPDRAYPRAGTAAARRPHGAELRRRRERGAAAHEMGPGSHDGRASHARRWADATVLGVRHVAGARGAQYTIRELDARALPGTHPSRCLVFENHSVVRRIWQYPAEWLELSDAALLAIAGLAP